MNSKIDGSSGGQLVSQAGHTVAPDNAGGPKPVDVENKTPRNSGAMHQTSLGDRSVTTDEEALSHNSSANEPSADDQLVEELDIDMPEQEVDGLGEQPDDKETATDIYGKPKSSIFQKVKNALRSDSVKSKPHHHRGYMFGGAALFTLGTVLLAIPPGILGIPFFTMGLMAYTWSFVEASDNELDDSGAGGQEANQPENKKENDQKKTESNVADAKKGEGVDLSGDEERKKAESIADNAKNNAKKVAEEDAEEDAKDGIYKQQAEGEFIARPIDFSGGKLEFPEGVKPVPPPRLKPGYLGPGFGGVYDAVTAMGVPGQTANRFMNGCATHLSSLSPSRAQNPAQLMNIPLAQNFVDQCVQANGQGVVPNTANLHNLPGVDGGLFQHATPAHWMGPNTMAPKGSPLIVINNITNNNNGANGHNTESHNADGNKTDSNNNINEDTGMQHNEEAEYSLSGGEGMISSEFIEGEVAAKKTVEILKQTSAMPGVNDTKKLTVQTIVDALESAGSKQ
ncbi:MAG: hypothetical protein QS721_01235 [Candidatus Endonucleobacter sp. (ex Gigantidas childressi)]|nr:hypothetical protein [Candidatus Endonucleobacter sp. (ex Gigantidas childressi)]